MNVTATMAMEMPTMMLVVSGSPNISVPTMMAVMGSEYAEYRSLGGSDVTGGNGEGGRRNDGWQQGKSHKVKPVCFGSDSSRNCSVGTEDFSDKDNRSYHEGIEGEQGVGYAGNGLAPVDDDDEECIHQCRRRWRAAHRWG